MDAWRVKAHRDNESSARVLVFSPVRNLLESSVLVSYPTSTGTPLTYNHDLELAKVSPLWQGIPHSQAQEAST